MNLYQFSSFRPFLRRPAASAAYGVLVAVSAFLLTGCPQPVPPPTPSPTPTPTPAPTVAEEATPAAPVAKYSGVQQMQYLATARDAFIQERQTNSQPYLDAHAALEAAGGASAKGLTTKDSIAARRDLIAKSIAANDQYLNFVKTQEDTYRADLAKTPLVPGDIDVVVGEYAAHANSAAVAKLRESDRDALKAADDMMAALDKTYGTWAVDGTGRLSFKKKGASAPYAAAAEKYNKVTAEEQKLLQVVNAAVTVPSASVPPSASVSPAGSPGAGASPAASVPGNALPPTR